jgi:hypothetical protein
MLRCNSDFAPTITVERALYTSPMLQCNMHVRVVVRPVAIR